jgi:hypothetical protein
MALYSPPRLGPSSYSPPKFSYYNSEGFNNNENYDNTNDDNMEQNPPEEYISCSINQEISRLLRNAGLLNVVRMGPHRRQKYLVYIGKPYLLEAICTLLFINLTKFNSLLICVFTRQPKANYKSSTRKDGYKQAHIHKER